MSTLTKNDKIILLTEIKKYLPQSFIFDLNDDYPILRNTEGISDFASDVVISIDNDRFILSVTGSKFEYDFTDYIRLIWDCYYRSCNDISKSNWSKDVCKIEFIDLHSFMINFFKDKFLHL